MRIINHSLHQGPSGRTDVVAANTRAPTATPLPVYKADAKIDQLAFAGLRPRA